MGLFDNNVITPSSIEQLGEDLKRAFYTRMDLDRYRRCKLRLDDPSSMDVEKILVSLVASEFRERLENNGVRVWETSAMKKTAGYARISYLVNFNMHFRDSEMTKKFQYEYIWR